MTAPVSVKLDDGIAVITIDNPPVNAISASVRRGLLAAVEQLASEQAVAAIVLVCAGPTFMVGADIGEFGGTLQPDLGEVLMALESLPQPVVIGMQGSALGGGAEVALAGHFRLADSAAKIGFPEITLGIVPGAGGTQRLPRLIGAEAALRMILGGTPLTAGEAKTLGLVDEIVVGDLRAACIAYARGLIAEGRGPRRVRDITALPLTDARLAEIRGQARAQYKGVITPELDLLALRGAWELPFALGLAAERAISGGSLQTPESRALRHLFFSERAVTQVPGIGKTEVPRAVKRIGIVGSGTMGGGIAMAFANVGIPVILIDVDQAALDRGLATVRRNYDTSVKRGRMTPEEVGQRMGLLQSSTDYGALKDVDLVIEAVFEDMALKKKIFTALDGVCRPGAVLATNTSTLDINQIAAVTQRPGDVIGLHFFSPANVMRLLEIVRTDTTSGDVVATAFQLAKQIRKIGVLSKVCFGFIGNRMMDPYAREAERLVLEGATPAQVDGALEEFGMAMGILAVFDMAGIDVGVKVRQANPAQASTDPAFYRADQVLFSQGWFGQKAGRGYYRYEQGSRARLEHVEALALLEAEAMKLGLKRRSDITAHEIVERCLYSMINEGARILEEGVALRPGDIDVVYTSGYGFPRFRGGPMFHADEIGLDTVLAGIRKYGRLGHAPDWTPAPLLVKLAGAGSSFAAWQAARNAGV